MKSKEEIFKGLAKDVKTQNDLSELIGQLMKTVVESALNSELEEHLGYEKNSKSESRKTNTRNGYNPKTIKGDLGEIEIQNPRDRDSTFEPQLIPKNKTRMNDFVKKGSDLD